jgi:hypothetical protein
VTVVQSGRRSKFNIVERTTWKGGAWNEHDSTRHNLTMTETDVSGILRFKSEGPKPPEFFLVALGVDKPENPKYRNDPDPPENPKRGNHPEPPILRWCDLKVNAGPDDVAVLLHPKYYREGTIEYGKKKLHLGKVHQQTKKGTDITVEYYFDEDLLAEEDWLGGKDLQVPKRIEFLPLRAVKITIT